MLDHDTLGSTSRSRCVHDAGKVVSLGWNGLSWVVVTQTQQLVEADNLQMGVRAGEGIDIFLLSVILGAVDNDADILGLVERLHKSRKQLRVGEHDLCVRLLHAVRETLFAESVVCGNNGKRLREGAVSRCQPLHTRGSKQVHTVVGLVAEVGKSRSHSQSHLLELDKTLVTIGAQLEVLPFLVHLLLPAINHLLDFLRLFVNVDDFARTNSLCVAKLGGRVAQDIVQCFDALLRRVSQTILRHEIAAWYRLALRLLDTRRLTCVRPRT